MRIPLASGDGEGAPTSVAPTLLVSAEICGVTDVTQVGGTARAHAAAVARMLLDDVIEGSIGLDLVSVEPGRALFARRGDLYASAAVFPLIVTKAYARFSARLRELIALRTCFCEFCWDLEDLGLRVVAHSGELAWRHARRGVELIGRAAGFVQAVGSSAAPAAGYLLLTDPLHERIDPVMRSKAVTIVQEIEGIGPTVTHYLAMAGGPEPSPRAPRWRKLAARLALETLALPARLGLAPVVGGSHPVQPT